MNQYGIYQNKGNEPTLLPYVNRGYAHYANGAYGEVYVTGEYKIYFKPMKLVEGETYESNEPHRQLGRGFIAYYIVNDGEDTLTMLKSYFEMSLQRYIKAHQHDASAWKKACASDWAKEYLPIHIKEEEACKGECDALFTYLSQSDKDKVLDFLDNYIEWLYTSPLYHADRYTILKPLDLDADWTDNKKDVLIKAIARGYTEIEGTHLKWNKSYALLDYFVGKLFCNDSIKTRKNYYEDDVWENSGTLGNKSRLAELFQYPTIGKQRKRTNAKAPIDWQFIDRLF